MSVGIVGQTGSTSSPVGRTRVMDGWTDGRTGANASLGENKRREEEEKSALEEARIEKYRCIIQFGCSSSWT